MPKKNTVSKTNTQQLGRFLQEARVRAGLMQKDVATALGYQSAQFVSDWERGLRTPPGQTLKKLAELYRISIDDFYEIIFQERVNQLEKELKRDLYGTKA